MRNVTLLFLAMMILLGGCAGREAYPVQSYMPGDENKSCMILKAEMAQIESDIHKKLPKSDKTGGNILLGAGGVVIWPLWLFMDLKGADKIEMEAFQRRYNALALLAADKGCDMSPVGAEVTNKSKKEKDD